VDDQVLKGFIHSLSKSISNAIRCHLQELGFLHVSHMLRGYKLDPTVINALVERWRPGTHIFYLPCSECTIILEDIALQMGLPMDGGVVTRLVIVSGREDLYDALLRKVLNRFQGGQIYIKWLEDNYGELEKHETAIEKEQCDQEFILRLIGGRLMPDKSQNLVHLRWLLHLVNFKECSELSWGSSMLATLTIQPGLSN
ncbi:hypothetical protein J1N35_011540, partial [Gossypium stocksii]